MINNYCFITISHIISNLHVFNIKFTRFLHGIGTSSQTLCLYGNKIRTKITIFKAAHPENSPANDFLAFEYSFANNFSNLLKITLLRKNRVNEWIWILFYKSSFSFLWGVEICVFLFEKMLYIWSTWFFGKADNSVGFFKKLVLFISFLIRQLFYNFFWKAEDSKKFSSYVL